MPWPPSPAVMNPALFKLIVLSLKSAFRRAFRGVRTVKGAFLTVFSAGVLVMGFGPAVFAASMRGRPGIPHFDGYLDPYLPILILSSCLPVLFSSVGEAAISFTPA